VLFIDRTAPPAVTSRVRDIFNIANAIKSSKQGEARYSFTEKQIRGTRINHGKPRVL
jgi:hypothetical protein